MICSNKINDTHLCNTRLMVVDDHRLFREVIVEKLSYHRDFEVVAQVDTGLEALFQAKKLVPDIILLDISLEGMDGLQVARLIKEERLPCKIVMMSMHSELKYIQAAKRLPVDGYVRKQEAFQDLLIAIEHIKKGLSYFSPSLPSEIDNLEPNTSHTQLTEREQQIVILIAEGLSSKEIANHYSLSVKTIETHRSNLYRKLKMRNSAEITRYAIRQGWLDT